MVALMLLLSTETTTEEKMNMCTDDTTPPTTEDHKSFKRIWIHASRRNMHQICGDRKILNMKGSLGH